MADAGGATEVRVLTDLNITGKPAQFGRSVVAEVSERLIGQFAENLARELETSKSGTVTSGPAAAGTTAPAEQAAPQAGPPASDSLNLLSLVGGPVARRFTPVLTVLATLAAVALVRRLLRGRPS
jgi:hypothetical protein